MKENVGDLGPKAAFVSFSVTTGCQLAQNKEDINHLMDWVEGFQSWVPFNPHLIIFILV